MAGDSSNDQGGKRDGGARDIVTEAKERFERAKEAFKENRNLAIEDTKFVLGDSDNGWQWPSEIYTNRAKVEKRPCLTVNVTAQHCNQVINAIRQNRPQAKVLAADGKASKKTADILAGMIRAIQADSHADVAHDTAAEHSVYGGEGYWVITTDYENERSFDQVVLIEPIENPQLVYIDPFCGMDRLKARWGFVFEEITKEECKNQYKVDPATWQMDAAVGWVGEHTVRIARYFWCDDVPDTLYMLPDGSVITESEAKEQGGDQLVAKVKTTAEALAKQTGGTTSRPSVRRQWYFCKLVGGHDKEIEKKEWPGQYLPIVQVVGKEVNVNGKIVRKGVVRDLKDQGRMINYSYSGAIETVSLQNKIPYIAAAEAIEGYEDQWKSANQSTASYLPFNAFDEAGNAIPPPKRQEPAVVPQAQISMLQLSTEEMRAASGMQNSNFGIKSEASSGVGIQRLKVQGETATFHFPDNLARALHDELVIIADLIPRVYDTRRIVRMLGIDGKDSMALLDPEHPSAYGDITEGEVKQMFNPNIGRYTFAIDAGPSYQTQRQEASAAMTELSTRNPQLMQIAGDIVMQAYDFPFSEQLAERFRKTLPPNLLEDGEPEIPPQAKAQMDQMSQQIQQLAQALEMAHGELDEMRGDVHAKFNDALIKAYDAETKRITALGGAMSPDIVQQLVVRTLQDVLGTPPLGQEVSEADPPDGGPPGQAGMPMHNEFEEPPQGGFSLPGQESGEQSPPAMAATGAQPGLGAMPILSEGNQQ